MGGICIHLRYKTKIVVSINLLSLIQFYAKTKNQPNKRAKKN